MRRLGGRRNARGGAGGGLEVPQTVSGLYAWWRADSGITLSTGVSSWADKTGQHTAVQATGANQPAYTTAAELGGKPVVSFDGSNDVLIETGPKSKWAFMNSGTGYTAFGVMVLRSPVHGSPESIFTTTNSNSPTLPGVTFGLFGGASDFIETCVQKSTSGRTVYAFASPAGSLDNVKTVISASYIEGGTPEYNFTYGNVSFGSGSSLNAPIAEAPFHDLYIGNSGNGFGACKGDIAEFMIYNRVVTDGEHTAIYNYLNARYT